MMQIDARALGNCVLGLAAILLIADALAQDSKVSAFNTPRLAIGVDANYALDMERSGAEWKWNGTESDPFEGMSKQGVKEFRVRLWTKDDGPHGKTYATEILKRTLNAGLNPYLVIFLSEDWADMMKQPLPAAWRGLSFEDRASAIRAYSKDIVAHFRREGLTSHMYEIGNEIDYGICGEYPGKGAKKKPEALSRRIWPRSAQLIRASQEGVRASDPDARFMLHISHWWDADFCVAFFRFMIEQGVQVDYAGLSYFPSSNIGGSLEMEEFGDTVTRLAEAISRPVIVPETAYPSTRDFTGQFSRWKYEVLGYPLTPAGQRRWVSDFLTFCNSHPNIEAVYYWSPEWYGEGMWKAFALFDPNGESKPAWEAFAQESWRGRPRKSIYIEAQSNQLFVVPVQEAKERMVSMVAKLREQTGGITKEHISLLTNTELKVGSYSVDLKASLQKNLRLSLLPGSRGILHGEASPGASQELTAIVAGVNPEKERVVLIVREQPTPALQQVIELFGQNRVKVLVHPRYDDGPLNFGMSGDFDP